MNFIYAIENAAVVTAKVLDECGLGGIIRQPVAQRTTHAGPGGGFCSLVTSGSAGQCLYEPKKQTWEKSLSGKFRIGYYDESPPRPEELVRSDTIAGHEIDLGEKGKWRIPLARRFPAGTCLPQSLIMGADGKVTERPIAKYAEFSAQAQRLWDDFMIQIGVDEGAETLEKEAEMLLGIEAITLNYHVGVDEINALELFTTQNFEDVLYAIVDVPTFKKAMEIRLEQKKKQAEDSGTDG